MLLAAVALAPALAQTPQAASPVMLDRVVAVVNNQAILASDLEQEKRLSALAPPAACLFTPATLTTNTIPPPLRRATSTSVETRAAIQP